MRNSWTVLALIALCGCAGEKAAEPKAAGPPKEKRKPSAEYRVKLETTKGEILIEVKREWAPKGSDHFFELVQSGFYDNVRFHRVLDGFIAQFGINGDPSIQQLYAGMRIPDDPVKLKNKRGTVCYAKVGPNSRTTEVFINLKDNAVLDSTGFAAFGKVLEGMDVADKISSWYGELGPKGRGPDPAKAQQLGNKYLDDKFPKLDAIRKAVIVGVPQ